MLSFSIECLLFFAITAVLTEHSQAQLVTYQFSGTRSSGSASIGSTIRGSLTLDLGAAPDYLENLTCGQYGYWGNGDFSIDVVTDTGWATGTSLGGDTFFIENDNACFPVTHSLKLYNTSTDSSYKSHVELHSYDYEIAGDGVANVPRIWAPLASQGYYLLVRITDILTGQEESVFFTLDTFSLLSTIQVDGHDTGIDDFEYRGSMVSKLLEDCAADARSHGSYVSAVAKLTNTLQKAKRLSGAEKGVIMSYAAKSRIGK